MTFCDYQQFKKLKDLAKNPYDLTQKDHLSPERIQQMQLSALNFSLLYATERIDNQTVQALYALAEEADVKSKMAMMQKGEIINQIKGCESEKRSVLHTAMRDFFDDPIQEKTAYEAAKLAHDEYKKLDTFLQKTGEFEEIIQIGIGGSDLGPRALYIALEKYRQPKKRAHFISNVDPDDTASVLQNIDLKKSLIVVVSKSGSTLETLTNESFIREQLKKKGLKPKDHLIAVTGKGSPMDDPKQYREVFYIWDYVGGRYSATSMVGAVMLSFTLGIKQFEQILKGANAMDKHVLKAPPEDNLPLLAALLGIWNRNFLGHPTLAVIPYSQALLRFPAHLQQLDMESNGKRIDKQGNPLSYSSGPIVWGEVGTNGQHSFFQLLHQGTNVVPIEFIGFKESQYGLDIEVEGTTSQQKLLSNLFAQSIALATGKKDDNPNKQFEGNRPSSILLAQKLTPEILGSLLAFYEHKVAYQGFIWGINSFDQEGVQLGKVLAKKMISLFSGKDSFPLGEAYIQSLEKL